MQQAVDRPLRTGGNRPLKLVPRGAECGPAKQVARPAQIPGPLGIRRIGANAHWGSAARPLGQRAVPARAREFRSTSAQLRSPYSGPSPKDEG